MIDTSTFWHSIRKEFMMEYSEWFSLGTKPDLNGVDQGRHTSKPDEIKYHLYKDGWRVGCDSAKEAEKMIEKFRCRSRLNIEIRGTTKVWRMGEVNGIEREWEWRGLAEKPKGNYRFETSDKYK